MSRPTLPAIVLAVVRWVSPRHRAEEIVHDLVDDYARIRADNRRQSASWWLIKEAASLALAYAAARASAIGTLTRISVRDASLVCEACAADRSPRSAQPHCCRRA